MLVVLTSTPYFLARAAAPSRTVYNWILPPYPDDALAYLAWVKQAILGAWLFKVKFTALPQPAILFQPFFLLAGLICRATGAGPGFGLFLLRGLGVTVFLLALDRFVRRFPLTAGGHALALALASVSSGWGFLQAWGWLRPPLGNSADLWLVDSNTLWSLTWNPVYPFALALMLTIINLWLDEKETGRGRRVLLAGALTSLLILVHPYDVGIVGLVAVAVALRRPRQAARELSFFALAAAPGLLYQLWVLARDPLLSNHAKLGLMTSPSPVDLLWGFGFPGLLALAGVAVLIRRRCLREFFPALIWVAGALAAAYAPVWFQRKFLFGAHLPICLLAAVGADAALSRVAKLAAGRRPAHAALAAVLVLLTVPTHLVNLQRTAALMRLPEDVELYYVDAELRAAFASLAAGSRPDDVVFAEPSVLSLLIPVWSGNTVVSGHWAQSVGSDAVQFGIRQALDPAAKLDDRQRRARFLDAGIRFIVFDRSLRLAAGGEVPRWLKESSPAVFRAPQIQIYRLTAAAD
jgi:hypothetical protein